MYGFAVWMPWGLFLLLLHRIRYFGNIQAILYAETRDCNVRMRNNNKLDIWLEMQRIKENTFMKTNVMHNAMRHKIHFIENKNKNINISS